MLNSIKSFVITFCVAILIFGLVAWFVVGRVSETFGLVETTDTSSSSSLPVDSDITSGSENVNPPDTDVPPIEGPDGTSDITGEEETGAESEVSFNPEKIKGESFTMLLIGTDFLPEVLTDYPDELYILAEQKKAAAEAAETKESDTTVAPNVNLTVTDGTLTGTGESGYQLAVYSYSYGNSLKNTKVTVRGGTIVGDIALTGGKNKEALETVTVTGGNLTNLYSYGDEAKATAAISITGGVFEANEAEIYAKDDGYAFVKNAEGKYAVEAVELISFKNANMTLGNTLALNFYLLKEDLEGTDYYAKVVHSRASGDEETVIPYGEWLNDETNSAQIYVPTQESQQRK